MMQNISAVVIGLGVTIAAILGQLILPFAFDFVSTLAVFGAGFYVGKAMK